jgi:carboxyl-terminal processing protease
MLRFGIRCILTGLVALLAGLPPLRAAPGAEALSFSEVYEAIRAHLAGVTDAELNQAAVQGLVSALAPRVLLLTNRNEAQQGTTGALAVSKSSLYDDAIAYVRVERIGNGLAEAVRSAFDQLARTNPIKGMVLDLRYAGGNDYAAAAAVADLFVKKQCPLMNWGAGMAQSKPKSDAIPVPLAALVNHQTAGAAEALAALVRQTGTGLILGGKTAGQAMMAQEYPLKNGDRLRIATAPIQLGDGSAMSGGVHPDIAIEVSPQDERAYYADAYKGATASNPAGLGPGATNAAVGANAARRMRFNEAELVREHREGLNPDAEIAPPRAREPDKPVVHDPVLARALDLLKGLAVVRQARS